MSGEIRTTGDLPELLTVVSRHWCEQSDGLERYGWLKHDGSDFGIQEIIDDPFVFTTSFVKVKGGDNGGDWTARVSVDTKVRVC